MTLELNGAWTLVAGLATILIGRALNRALPWLDRSNIPPAVSAGLTLSLVLAGYQECCASTSIFIDIRRAFGRRPDEHLAPKALRQRRLRGGECGVAQNELQFG